MPSSCFNHKRHSHNIIRHALTVLQPIQCATSTHQHCTVSANLEEHWHPIGALFALPGPIPIAPLMNSALFSTPDPQLLHPVSHSILECAWLSAPHILPHFIFHPPFRINEQSCLIPLPTPTSFPRHRTQVAKLSLAAARNVIATLRERDDGAAPGASLPAFLLCESL